MLDNLKKIRDLFGVGHFLDRDTEPTQEAKQQRLNKSAKIQTGLEAVVVNQMQNIAKDEIAESRQLKDQTVFGGEKKLPQRGETDDMLIADDIRVTNVKSGGAMPALVGVAAGAAAIYFGMPFLAGPAKATVEKVVEERIIEKPVERVIEKPGQDFDYEVESRVIPPN